MAAFIVISADNRLHYIVDGIEKCRPLNPCVSAEISTGKIKKTESGYTYEYTIHGEGNKAEGVKSFSNLLSNQLAAFRLAYAIPENQLVNIFFLENPLTEADLDESESWINEFNEVYRAGNDTDFCLFRVVFTYDHNNPCDISTKNNQQVLKRLLNSHKEAVSCNIGDGVKSAFERYIFYIDNQKSDSAALCLCKDEHDLKMPRFLIDFMMLVSDEHNRYNIINAINPVTVTTHCFSVGFAESMYYYPDVERYFSSADIRDLNWAMLSSTDDRPTESDKNIMDIEKFPFGLRERKNRLNELYQDIPFSEDITHYENTADYKVYKYISQLKDLLQKERQQEYEDFMNSEEVVCLKKSIECLNDKIDNAKPVEDESTEDYENRIKQLTKKRQEKETEYNKIISNFEPICPEYTNRDEIFLDLSVADEDDIVTVDTKKKQYIDLVEFAKSRQFLDFVKKEILAKTKPQEDCQQKEIITNNTEQKLGCLSFLFFWKKNNKGTSLQGNSADSPIQVQNEPSPQDIIKGINEQLILKKTFRQFIEDVESIESDYKAGQKECEDFKLTEHENHYFPIINLGKLRKEQQRSSNERRDSCITEWRAQSKPTKSSLFDLIRKRTSDYTSKSFPYVKWDHPYSFVQDITADGNLAVICNQLQRRSAPVVNYNLTTDLKGDTITRILFSDRPKFSSEILDIRNKLQNGLSIAGVESTHIASKICMLQFLPMDDDILENLVDLQDSEIDIMSTSIVK